MMLAVTPVALGLLLTGDVYYERKGELRTFGPANKVVAGVGAAFIALYAVAQLVAAA